MTMRRRRLQTISTLLMQRGRARWRSTVRRRGRRSAGSSGSPPTAQSTSRICWVERWRRDRRVAVEAQKQEAAGRALSAEGRDAASAYRDILQIDAAHSLAIAQLNRIEAQMVARATAAAEAGDYATSDRMLADAARVQPGSSGVQDASTRIVELRQNRADELLMQAHAAAAAGDLARAEALLADLERVSAQSAGIDECG